MLPCPNHVAVGGGTVWSCGSRDVGFPQRSYVVLLLNITGVLGSFLRRTVVLFQKDAVTKSKSQKCKVVETLAIPNGTFRPRLLQMEEKRRLVF